MSLPVAYAYDADTHCPDCAVARFGRQPDRPWVREDAEDAEGNPVSPIFPWDDDDPDGLYCGDCGDMMSEPWPDAFADRD